MNRSIKYLHLGLFSILFLGLQSCTNPESTSSNTSQVIEIQEPAQKEEEKLPEVESEIEKPRSEVNLPIPEGYILYEEIKGDLNGDELDDYILIIKDTKKENIVQDEYRGELDRNRRGILIYFKNNDKYDLILENLNCFSSENEDGGVYFPPELSVNINKGKIFMDYAHGRYGYWQYTFRYKDSNSDFELIGYDSSENYGPIINKETSINFLTKKKLIRENTNKDIEESGEEVFKETWENLKLEKLFQLSEIKDFDELQVN